MALHSEEEFVFLSIYNQGMGRKGRLCLFFKGSHSFVTEQEHQGAVFRELAQAQLVLVLEYPGFTQKELRSTRTTAESIRSHLTKFLYWLHSPLGTGFLATHFARFLVSEIIIGGHCAGSIVALQALLHYDTKTLVQSPIIGLLLRSPLPTITAISLRFARKILWLVLEKNSYRRS